MIRRVVFGEARKGGSCVFFAFGPRGLTQPAATVLGGAGGRYA